MIVFCSACAQNGSVFSRAIIGSHFSCFRPVLTHTKERKIQNDEYKCVRCSVRLKFTDGHLVGEREHALQHQPDLGFIFSVGEGGNIRY